MSSLVIEIDMDKFRNVLKEKGYAAKSILEIQSALEESFVE